MIPCFAGDCPASCHASSKDLRHADRLTPTSSRAPKELQRLFADLPGCVSAGAATQKSVPGAKEALSGHPAVMAPYGDAISGPSLIDAVGRDVGVDEAARILVCGERPGRAVRVQVSIDEGLLARIDRIATNRSEFLADAARRSLRP